MNEDTILVNVKEEITTRRRGRGPMELKVDVLAKNVNLFMNQIERILEKTPDEVGSKFKFTEFSVSAEISAKGGLMLMGTGVEIEGKGGLTFKFNRK